MTVYLVVDVPDHHRCDVSPLMSDPVAIYSSERAAWLRCKAIGTHSIGYTPTELDRDYAVGEKILTVYPNCPLHSYPQPQPAEMVVGG